MSSKPKLTEHDLDVKDHLDEDETAQCGYCGHHFLSGEARILRRLYGREWAFCTEECLAQFKDASNFQDENLDGYKHDPDDDQSPEMAAKIHFLGDDEE